MCEHKWVFQESSYSRSSGGYNDTFDRIDSYYCEKCLELKEKNTKHENARCTPYWYKK